MTRGYLHNKFDKMTHNIYTSHFYTYGEKIWIYVHIYGYMLRTVQDNNRVVKYTDGVKHRRLEDPYDGDT